MQKKYTRADTGDFLMILWCGFSGKKLYFFYGKKDEHTEKKLYFFLKIEKYNFLRPKNSKK